MSTTSITIFTQINGSHQESELIIDWSIITQEQILVLAQRAIIAAIQQDYRANGSAPNKAVVNAHWFLDRSTPSPIRKIPKIADLPDYIRGNPSKDEIIRTPTADGILAKLTPEQKAAMLKVLQEQDFSLLK